MDRRRNELQNKRRVTPNNNRYIISCIQSSGGEHCMRLKHGCPILSFILFFVKKLLTTKTKHANHRQYIFIPGV